MSGLIIVFAVMAALIVFDMLAQAFGVDSREEFEDPRQPARGISF